MVHILVTPQYIHWGLYFLKFPEMFFLEILFIIVMYYVVIVYFINK